MTGIFRQEQAPHTRHLPLGPHMTWPAPDATLKTPVSCIIIAHNEVDRIAATIRSVVGIVAEVIVIDSGSTDGTQQLCESLGARLSSTHGKATARKNALPRIRPVTTWCSTSMPMSG